MGKRKYTRSTHDEEAQASNQVAASRKGKRKIYDAKDLIGRQVERRFSDHGVTKGRVASFEVFQGAHWFRIEYDNGDSEDLDYHRLEIFLVEDPGEPRVSKCWTPEEERYAQQIIIDFHMGLLQVCSVITCLKAQFVSYLVRFQLFASLLKARQ